ncbi:MAG: cytochrome c oxidase subunit II [Bacteroidales bacterium]|nr:cytochrome c oxidase subunit II [Bacteroidales bacterium]
MYQGISNYSEGVDTAFMVILGISFAFLIGLTVTMIYFVIRYNKKRHPKATQIKGSTALEIVWTVVPTILVLVMFYFGWSGWRPMHDIPEDAMKVKSIARMWKFSFEYENGKTSEKLYIPKGEPVVLDLISRDVIHSLYIPAFRVKEDMVPGRTKQMWFQANKTGSFDLFCAEYCGLRHSYMTTTVEVLPQEEFKSWIADTTGVATAEGEEAKPGTAGKQIIERLGCVSCHSLDGTKLVGPTFKNLWGKTEMVTTDGDERQITVDKEYIKRSIYQPNVDIVEGYREGQMVSYKEELSDADIDAIVEFLKTIDEEE